MHVHDRTNIRELTLDIVGEPVDLVVGDLSFISLALVLDPLLSVTREDGALALMVKPQFEVGKDRVGKGGVVRDLGTARGIGHRDRRPGGRPWLGCGGGDGEPAAGTVGQRRVLPAAAPGRGSDRRGRDPRRGRADGLDGGAG